MTGKQAFSKQGLENGGKVGTEINYKYIIDERGSLECWSVFSRK